MPSLNETRELLETAFIDGWGITTPIKFDNVVFDDTIVTDSFVSVKMINYTTENTCIGSAITKRHRHIGVFSTKIFIKQNIGTGSAYSHANNVSIIMSNLIRNNLFTKASMTRSMGESEDGWFGLIVDTPYISDEE